MHVVSDQQILCGGTFLRVVGITAGKYTERFRGHINDLGLRSRAYVPV
jgi:hypothetical protein